MPERDSFAAVVRRAFPEAELVRSWPLVGGVSASLHALEIRGADGQLQRVVLRQPGVHDWKPQEQGGAAREFAVLGALARAGFAVPEPLRLDESGELLPTPYFVMAFVEGTTAVAPALLTPALRAMADYLARLHRLDVERLALPPLPEREDPYEAMLEYLPAGPLGQELRARLGEAPTGERIQASSPRALLHGDFWPGNILWRGAQIAAVLDWEDAATGDPLSDLAAARVELLCEYDAAAMDAFTGHYVAAIAPDLARLSIWELYVSCAALATMDRWGLEPAALAERRRRTTQFMERAAASVLAGHTV